MTWLWRLLFGAPDTDRRGDPVAPVDGRGFVCTTCGRSDLPPAGDWDPPICVECDAGINQDAIEEAAYHDDL